MKTLVINLDVMDNEPEKGEKALLIFFQWTV
jgi:hypothetical protein